MIALLKVPDSFIAKVEQCERKLDALELVTYCEALEVDPREAFEILVKKPTRIKRFRR